MTGVLPRVTVVVCTYNRARLLHSCIDSLSCQDADPTSYEVLVIDNGSTDGTSDFLGNCSYDCFQFRWIFEPVPGLSNARNRGWLEARGEYVAFLDDDAIAEPGWISAILSFSLQCPDVVMFGGPYEAYVTDPVPSWFPIECGGMDLGREKRAIDCRTEFLVGLNMVFRRDTLVDLGGFDVHLGMKGGVVSYGEETQLQIMLKSRGHDVYYLPQMKVRHHLAARKMRLVWALRSAYAVGRCSALTWKRRRSLFSHLAGLAFGFIHATKALLERTNTPFRRKVYFALVPLVSEYGALIEYLRVDDDNHESTIACSGKGAE